MVAGQLGHDDPEVALEAEQDPAQFVAAGGPCEPDGGLRLVDVAVCRRLHVVLADPPAVEQARGPVVTTPCVDLHDRRAYCRPPSGQRGARGEVDEVPSDPPQASVARATRSMPKAVRMAR